MSTEKCVLEYTKKALSKGNNERYSLALTLAECKDGFVFEAKIPRHAENDLGLSVLWSAASRQEAAEFLRQLLVLIENKKESKSKDI